MQKAEFQRSIETKAKELGWDEIPVQVADDPETSFTLQRLQ